MLHAQVLERVRDIVKRQFSDHGIEPGSDFAETILIRDGYYCGRSFTSGGMRAVWFVDEDLIKIFGRDHSLLGTQTVDRGSEESIAAA
ncbi:MAG: hypothetical protein AB7F89_24000 [Pirellulaceae bacterium]